MSFSLFKTRLYAFVLDYLIIVLYGLLVVGGISFILRSSITPLFSHSPVTAQWTGFLLITFPVSLYFIISEQSEWKGTVGKRKAGICVVDLTGERIGIGRSILRTTIKFLPWEAAHFVVWNLILPSGFSERTLYVILSVVYITVFLYLILPLTNPMRRNVYDWVAGTAVINK
ncbi:RDD family protein [Halobacillus halophilus]|uniref:RDD family protein n=1 Tax=Halobacillus halophilus TaxID=1570 RepID=UPI001CD41316|nr:RDD family protein [Halobacillus halophilus]MCA1012780.1 RDD family protein [Halobacillus halophilus]